ncbi:hypothetical protein INR49_003918 [Caranx melampygus]|nr:hypothetical protein INR49_003918 [Caranx melampygus]
MISHSISKAPTGQLTLNVQAHLTAGNEVLSQFVCQFPESGCTLTGRPPAFPKCTCILSDSILPTEGLEVPVRIRLGSVKLLERLTLTNCSDIMGAPTAVLCQQCISAGCGWSINRCTWANQGERNVSVCQLGMLGTNISKPEIFSITPSVVSFHGKNHAVLTGRNLSHVTRVRILTESCSPRESPVWNNTGMSLTFHILSADSKGSAEVCALLPDGSCHGNENITYQSAPLCTSSTPTSTWVSGKRRITLTGSHLDFVEGVTHSHAPQEIKLPGNSSYETLTYDSPAARHTQETLNSTVSLKVANQTVSCSTSIAYYPDPEFTSFTSTRRGDDVRIIIEKKADRLEMTTAELTAYGIHGGKPHRCIMVVKETKNLSDFFTCDIKSTPVTKFQELEIKYGDRTVRLNLKSPPMNLLMLLVLLLIPIIIIMLVIVYRRKQQKFTAEMNRMMEDLEMDIRNDIRQGFVDLQTEKAELMENVGAIPFLDYKHFASRIFFPESDSLMTSCIRDIGQDAVKVQLDECCQGLSRLIQNQLFLTTMVHALEEQKSFTIKDKCLLASLLTVALHGNLSYLTEVMETLLKALMQQNSNTQPKLLLRRTESTVEKLLTNWMSICLYGYLRESVGQHLFLMVSTLSQQITKGPVDCKLKVLFAVGSDGEVSEPLEVNALSCDSVEQVKEKILSTFKAKFGFPYNFPLRDICIEIEKNSSFVLLEEVDRSSEVVGEVTMLNTLRHYKVPDGATIKVLSKTARPPLSPQGSLKDDENFSGKYFHLIDPDVVEDQRKNPERKKLKLKEVHLTKLLSTKVAVHSSVENLFRSIWGTPHSRALHAVKYFFDFLDAQADNMKITDPDVLHIWKTNSLPLRFWVNILKNPQFVFDMEKSPHLDGCLSHAPTNKLLYAKDIPTFKQEVKAYYKQIRERPPITESEFNNFLQEESKKHENKFNEALALRELYRFIQRYFTELVFTITLDGFSDFQLEMEIRDDVIEKSLESHILIGQEPRVVHPCIRWCFLFLSCLNCTRVLQENKCGMLSVQYGAYQKKRDRTQDSRERNQGQNGGLVIKEKLDQNGVPTELTEQLHHVKGLFDQLKSCSWD